jgi:primosomal protein N' (replication factor Y)
LLAKGLDFKNVGLVGIINADVSLNIPDYRSPEKTYQLITQVAGRAGRTGGESRVIIQTYEPDSDIIREAAEGDYEEFYESELVHRSIMNYPPYSDIISVGFIAEDDETAMAYAEAFRKRLEGLRSAPEGAVIMKTRLDERRTDGRSRAVFIIKAPAGSRGGYVNEYMAFRDRMTENRATAFIEIDINPYGSI